MFIHCELLAAILVLTLDGRVYAGGIIGGQEAEPHSRPYMVLVEQHMQNGDTKQCGGFLLDEDFVMTAAHCKAKCLEVVLGLHDVLNSNGQQRISVVQTFTHVDYNGQDLRNNIMLLKLSSKAKFTKNVKPIALADDSSPPKSCRVSGWGQTDRDKERSSSVLMEVNVTLIEDKQCAEFNIYCSKAKTGVGHGDSGGPLVCEDGKAYGVVSFSVDPEIPEDGTKLSGFTQIPYFTDWITSTMTNAK